MSSSDKIPADQIAWREMDEFLDRCEAAGPPKSVEEAARRSTEFIAIQARCRARAAVIELKELCADNVTALPLRSRATP